jgi:hypothetical protein
MKIWIAANNEENFSMFVATCTDHRRKLAFWIGTWGVTPLETTAAVDPFLPVIFPKTDHCRMCIWHPCHHLTGVGHYRNLRSSTVISSSLSQSLFLKWLSHVRKPGHLPQMMPCFACWVPDGCLPKTFSFPQRLFVSSAEQPPPSFAVSLFLVGRNMLTLGVDASHFWSYRRQRANISFWDGNHNLCRSWHWIKFLECSRSVLIHCQGRRILIKTHLFRKKVVLPKDVTIIRIKCSNLETLVCIVCCSSCEISTSK